MIGATNRAKEELKRIQEANVTEAEGHLRLAADDYGQLHLVMDEEREGDEVIEFEESKVLLVERELADMLVGVTLDVEETSDGSELVISRQPE